MNKSYRVSVRITERQKAKLNILSNDTGKSSSYLISEMIDFCIKDSKNIIYNKEPICVHLLNAINIANSLDSNEGVMLKRELEGMLCQF